MRITKNRRVIFRFPTCFIANCFTLGAIRRKLKKNGIILSRKQTKAAVKGLKRYKKSHEDWNLVEVFSPRGDIVDIIKVKI